MSANNYQLSLFLRLLLRLALALLFFTHHSKASSSGSRSRYAAYDYDLTTPQYTPDGRLLQVEYALNACRRAESNPIVSVGLCIPSKKDFRTRRLLQLQQEQSNDDSNKREVSSSDKIIEEEQGGDALLIMATISSPPPSSASADGALVTNNNSIQKLDEDQAIDSDPNNTSYTTATNNQRTQRRIIEVPLTTSFQTHHTTTTTTESTVLIGLSGILADATSLLQIAYSILEEEQISFGWHRMGLSPIGTVAVDATKNSNKRSITKNDARPQQTAAQPSETAIRLARAVGDKCQKHAFGGGLRPLGASLLVTGVDSQSSSAKLAICETEPSGTVSVSNPFWSTIQTSADDKNIGIKPPQIMVSGGSIQNQIKLKQMMSTRTRQLYKKIGADLEDKERIYSEEVFLRNALQTVAKTLMEEWADRGSFASSSAKKQQSIPLPQMEIVFTIPRRGTFRLSEDDVKALTGTIDIEHKKS